MRKISAWLVPLALMTLIAVACSPPTGAERVAEMRGRYTAEVRNFVPREVPLVSEGSEAGAEGAEAEGEPDDAAAEDAAMDDGEGIEEETIVPTRTDVLLDILIRNENRENLPGLTLDVVLLPAGGDEEMTESDLLAAAERSWRIYVDSSTIGRGPGTSVTHTLEDVPGFEEGDRFAAFVRHPVPAGERGEYREFAEAG